MFRVAREDVSDEYLNKTIELQQSQVQQQHFRPTILLMFWCYQIVSHPLIAKKPLEILIPFVMYTVSLFAILFKDGKTENGKMIRKWHLPR